MREHLTRLMSFGRAFGWAVTKPLPAMRGEGFCHCHRGEKKFGAVNFHDWLWPGMFRGRRSAKSREGDAKKKCTSLYSCAHWAKVLDVFLKNPGGFFNYFFAVVSDWQPGKRWGFCGDGGGE